MLPTLDTLDTHPARPTPTIMASNPPASSSPVGSAAPVTLQSLEGLIAPLRYLDKGRVARDVLTLLRNTNSLAVQVAPFGKEPGRERRAKQGCVNRIGAVY